MPVSRSQLYGALPPRAYAVGGERPVDAVALSQPGRAQVKDVTKRLRLLAEHILLGRSRPMALAVTCMCGRFYCVSQRIRYRLHLKLLPTWAYQMVANSHAMYTQMPEEPDQCAIRLMM